MFRVDYTSLHWIAEIEQRSVGGIVTILHWIIANGRSKMHGVSLCLSRQTAKFISLLPLCTDGKIYFPKWSKCWSKRQKSRQTVWLCLGWIIVCQPFALFSNWNGRVQFYRASPVCFGESNQRWFRFPNSWTFEFPFAFYPTVRWTFPKRRKWRCWRNFARIWSIWSRTICQRCRFNCSRCARMRPKWLYRYSVSTIISIETTTNACSAKCAANRRI